MKFLLLSSTLLVTAALPSLAQTASGGASAGAGVASPSAAASGGVSVNRAATVNSSGTAPNGVTVQGNGTRVVTPVNPNTGLFTPTPAASAAATTPNGSAAATTPNGSATATTPNGTAGATTQDGSTSATTQNPNNGFTAAAGATNNNIAATNFFQVGTNFAGLNGSNRAFASNTNANSAGQDRGMTTFDTTLIFHIRRTVFDANPQLSALNPLVNFMSQGGSVTVSGTVPTPEMQTTVVNNVRAVPGVVNVTSRLVIDPRAAEVFARAKQPKPQPLLAPTSDPALGDSRVYSGNSNRVNTGTSTSTGQGTVSNNVDTSISTP